MSLQEAWIAATRFGFGARPGELERYEQSARAWLDRQLEQPQASPHLAGLPATEDVIASFGEVRAEKDREKKRRRKRELREVGRDLYKDECVARTRAAIESETPLVERLTHFWSNHFAVSVQKGPQLIALAGAMEREAIRPHVLGRFKDMLLAVERHPAMLLYLDNAQSIGPHSRAGAGNLRGLNENLAREILELHTLGVDGGYGQDDVIALAKIITGWTVDLPLDQDRNGFAYEGLRHEPGDKTLLGRTYRQDGEQEGIDALENLAAHPSTSYFIARKLATHFVADAPPPELVTYAAETFRMSGGNLKSTVRALFDRSESWQFLPGKVKTPNDLLISAARAAERSEPALDEFILNSLRQFGQMPFDVSSPAGWPDAAAHWAGPEAMLRRIQWARTAAKRLTPSVPAAELSRHVLYPILSGETYQAIQQAGGETEALALLFASPEFQRR